MDRPLRPYLSRQDTVYGVEELPEEETAPSPPLPYLDPNTPSTSTGVTVPPTGLILSHAQIHISTDSSSGYSAVREAIKEGKYEAGDDTGSGEHYAFTELDLIEPDAKEPTPEEPDSNERCPLNCFCLQKCKKSKEKKNKDQAEESKPPRPAQP